MKSVNFTVGNYRIYLDRFERKCNQTYYIFGQRFLGYPRKESNNRVENSI